MNTISPRYRVEEEPLAPLDDGVADLARLTLLARRHAGTLVLAALAGLGLAILYLALSRPVYEAHAMVLMRRPVPVAAGLPEGPDAIPDAQLRNELEVLRSREFAAEVLAGLGPEGFPGAPDDPHDDPRAREDHLGRLLRVSRLDDSYILAIDALGPDPEAAARLANAAAGTYVTRRARAMAEALAARRAGLGVKVDTLRAAVAARQAELVHAAHDGARFDEAIARRGELEQLLESDRAAYAEALALLRDADRAPDPNQLEAVILSDAVPPREATGPKSFMVLTLGLFLGLASAAGLALARENLDDTPRTGDAVRRGLGQPFLGYLPRLPGAATRAGLPRHPVWRTARDHPRSRYAETLRFIRAKAEARATQPGAAITLALASARPGAGKSLLAANLAALLAAEGARVLLIDADPRGAGLGATLRQPGAPALTDLLSRPELPEAPPGPDGFAFVAARGAGAAPLYVEAAVFERLLAPRRSRYDFILIDLPALEEAAFTRRALPLMDGWVAVLRWGVTPTHALRAILREEPGLARNLLGAVLSDLPPAALGRYTPHAGAADDA